MVAPGVTGALAVTEFDGVAGVFEALFDGEPIEMATLLGSIPNFCSVLAIAAESSLSKLCSAAVLPCPAFELVNAPMLLASETLLN